MSDTPSYDRPPLVEVVVGLQFRPSKAVSAGTIGSYWASRNTLWVSSEDVAPIPPSFELFRDEQDAETLGLLAVSNLPNSPILAPQFRSRFRDSDGTRMLQLQSDRIHYNWMGTRANEPYPRFAQIQAAFSEEFDAFTAHIEEPLVINHWEVTYINHIARGDGWERLGNLGAVVPGLLGESNDEIEQIQAAWTHRISGHRGRLHIEIKSGHRNLDQEPLLIFTLTARGPIHAGKAWQHGFECGHGAIVDFFSSVTSEDAHELWGRTK